MHFLLADTFTDSLSRLTGEEQKLVKFTALDLQINPANPGHQFHKLDRAKDRNFWSVRVGSDLRLIVHKTAGSLMLCYVDHHDKAYAWAERRRVEAHPTTGAAQMVEIRERIEEIKIPIYVEEPRPAVQKLPCFAGIADGVLLGYGVPADWLAVVREATEDSILDIADHLPNEAAEALLELATGGVPQVLLHAEATADPFEHPDARRRFRVVANVEELERALEYPWEKWSVFLHPAQRESVERDYSGPARISGTAGTGKTVVALHRAVFLARKHPNARVLLTTFSDTLANALRTKLSRLIGNEPRVAERIEVEAIDAVARRLFVANIGKAKIAPRETLAAILREAEAGIEGPKFKSGFVESEWNDIVDAWQVRTWDAYRDVARLGRKTRLPEARRAVLWRAFEHVRARLDAQGLMTQADLLSSLSEHFSAINKPPFDFIVVDEAQDVSVPQLRFIAALGGDRPNSLFFTGDLGQRIFQLPFSWKSLGVDIRGRSQTLKINYRTSHQIRSQADKLLAQTVSDVDGNMEDRRSAISVFNGPAPDIRVLDTEEAETDTAAEWLAVRVSEGTLPHEIGIFVRSNEQLSRAQAAAERAGIPYKILDERVDTAVGSASICTMHLAKGLEFRVVAVLACDDEVIPLQSRIESITDDTDLEEVYNTERHLLYVACTRARDHLLVTGVKPGSEFLEDLGG